MKYRPEIDGLRAIAVLSVLFFHAGLSFFQGGYIGVDIFFVISGFLITSIIISDLENARFSLKNFYERRIRRIIPALLVVCIVSCFISWKYMFPLQMETFATNLIGVITSTSNIFLWRQTGYFAPNNNLNFLIHTWSLAVEEQYYLIFPFLISLCWGFGKKRVFVFLCCVALASFSLAQVGVSHFPSASFYLLPTRTWEILSGAIIAFGLSSERFKLWIEQRTSLTVNLGSTVGLLAILFSIFIYSSTTPDPSWYTLIPICGTSLIIICSIRENWVKTLLSNRVFVAIGLISYSLYLWHQPVLAMGRLISIEEPTASEMIPFILGSFLLAYITWFMIEIPFRNASRVSRKFGAGAITSMMAVLICFSFLATKFEGFPKRFPDLNRLLNPFPSEEELACFNLPSGASNQSCKLGLSSSEPTIAIIGDSHVNRLSLAFSQKLKERGLASVVYSYSFCAPLIDFGRFDPGGRGGMGCRDQMNAAYDSIFNSSQIRTVILFAEWAYYTEGARWGDPNLALYSTDRFPDKNISKNKYHFEKALKQTGIELKKRGKNIIFVKSTPEYEVRVPDALAKLMIRGKPLTLPDDLLVDLAKYKTRNSNVETAISKTSLSQWAKIIDPIDEFCKRGVCDYISPNNFSLYEDANHLSYYGALRLVDYLFKKVPTSF